MSPDQLEHLTTVNVLSVSGNKLTQIPEEIANLKNLLRLDLTNNDLTA